MVNQFNATILFFKNFFKKFGFLILLFLFFLSISSSAFAEEPPEIVFSCQQIGNCNTFTSSFWFDCNSVVCSNTNVTTDTTYAYSDITSVLNGDTSCHYYCDSTQGNYIVQPYKKSYEETVCKTTTCFYYDGSICFTHSYCKDPYVKKSCNGYDIVETCASNELCQQEPYEPPVCACVPNCAGKDCGDDGCGGDCGPCPSGQTCQNDECVGECAPGETQECSETFGTCDVQGIQTCSEGIWGDCEGADDPKIANCLGKDCGDDGCGGSCGTCTAIKSCVGRTIMETTGECDNGQCAPAKEIEDCSKKPKTYGCRNECSTDPEIEIGSPDCPDDAPIGCSTVSGWRAKGLVSNYTCLTENLLGETVDPYCYVNWEYPPDSDCGSLQIKSVARCLGGNPSRATETNRCEVVRNEPYTPGDPTVGYLCESEHSIGSIHSCGAYGGVISRSCEGSKIKTLISYHTCFDPKESNPFLCENAYCDFGGTYSMYVDCGPAGETVVEYCSGGAQCTLTLSSPGTCTEVMGVPQCDLGDMEIVCDGSCDEDLLPDDLLPDDLLPDDLFPDDDVPVPDDLLPDDLLPDDLLPDDLLPDDLLPDDLLPDDLLPDDLLPDDLFPDDDVPVPDDLMPDDLIPDDLFPDDDVPAPDDLMPDDLLPDDIEPPLNPLQCNLSQQCVENGGGASCSTDEECQSLVLECNENKWCVMGGGGASCSTDEECQDLPPQCNENKQCVPGGGGIDCSTYLDCYSLEPSNTPPYADNLKSVAGSYCTGISGAGLAYFQWRYMDCDKDTQRKFIFQVDNNADFSSPEVDRTFSGLSYASGTTNQQSVLVRLTDAEPDDDFITYNTPYYWRVMVQDNLGLYSDYIYYNGFVGEDVLECDILPESLYFQKATRNSVLKASYTYGFDHPPPYPEFISYPSTPPPNEDVYFRDLSVCYDNVGPYACQDLNPISGVHNDYTWWFGDGNIDYTVGDVYHSYPTEGKYTVSLQVCDETACCLVEHLVPVKIERGSNLPKWKEVSPF